MFAVNLNDKKTQGKRRSGAAAFVLILLTAVFILTSLAPSRTAEASAASGGSFLMDGWREELSQGVKNTLLNALYMYDTFWTPLSDISAWGITKKTDKQFMAGHTYRGIPYGQPVHEGAYVGTTVSVSDFAAAVNDPSGLLYTARGKNTWHYTEYGGDIRYSPYYSNDCSGFVSAALRIRRHTTRDIGSDSELFPVTGRSVFKLRPGDLINSHEGGHVIMVYDVVYNRKGGKVVSVVTIEQTPDIIVMRSFGKGGLNGSLADLQNKIYLGSYYIRRYKYIDEVTLMDGAAEALPGRINSVSEPSSVMKTDAPAEGVLYVDFSQKSFTLSGWSIGREELCGFTYSVEGGSSSGLDGEYRPELTAPAFGFDYLSGVKGLNCYTGSVPLRGISPGDTLTVSGSLKDGGSILIASLEFRSRESRSFQSYIDSSPAVPDDGGVYHVKPGSGSAVIDGWCMADGLIRFEAQIDGGVWYPLGHSFRSDVYNRYGYDFPSCRDCNAFSCAVDFKSLGGGAHDVAIRAVALDGGTFNVAVCEYRGGLTAAAIIGIAAGSAAAAAAAAAAAIIIIRVKKKRSGKAAADVPPAGEPAS